MGLMKLMLLFFIDSWSEKLKAKNNSQRDGIICFFKMYFGTLRKVNLMFHGLESIFFCQLRNDHFDHF